jgi:hypothetical protein
MEETLLKIVVRLESKVAELEAKIDLLTKIQLDNLSKAKKNKLIDGK